MQLLSNSKAKAKVVEAEGQRFAVASSTLFSTHLSPMPAVQSGCSSTNFHTVYVQNKNVWWDEVHRATILLLYLFPSERTAVSL